LTATKFEEHDMRYLRPTVTQLTPLRAPDEPQPLSEPSVDGHDDATQRSRAAERAEKGRRR
jgi:hypothetical protein